MCGSNNIQLTVDKNINIEKLSYLNMLKITLENILKKSNFK